MSLMSVLDTSHPSQVDDVMEDEELKFGPNGGLVFAMEFLLENRVNYRLGPVIVHLSTLPLCQEWLEEALGEDEDDYILFDCPGQIELYTHMTVMKKLVDTLQVLYEVRLIDSVVVDSMLF